MNIWRTEEIDVKIKKFEVNGRKSTDLDGDYTITNIPNSDELSFDAPSISGSNLDYSNAIAHVSYPVEQEELTRLAVSMESLGLIISQWKETTDFLDSTDWISMLLRKKTMVGKSNWQLDNFNVKIDDLPSDLSLDVDSDRHWRPGIWHN